MEVFLFLLDLAMQSSFGFASSSLRKIYRCFRGKSSSFDGAVLRKDKHQHASSRQLQRVPEEIDLHNSDRGSPFSGMRPCFDIFSLKIILETAVSTMKEA
jgi:hypothetical protein